MKYLLKSITLVIALTLLATTGFSQVNFSSEDAGFSIAFPAEYTTDVAEKESATTHKVTCVDNNHTYMASYTFHQVTIVDHVDMAQVSLESFVSTLSANLVSQEEWKIKDHKGTRAIITMPDQDIKLEYRVILVGDIQYQLIAMALQSQYNEKSVEKFMKSFKLE